jgi:hypothetical protein
LTVCLSTEVLAALTAEAAAFEPLETGGILVGHRSGGDVVVRGSIDAGPAAERWRTGMRPDHEYQVALLEALFRRTNGSVLLPR